MGVGWRGLMAVHHWEPGSVRISGNKTSLERGIGLSVGVEKGWGLVLCKVIGNRLKKQMEDLKD